MSLVFVCSFVLAMARSIAASASVVIFNLFLLYLAIDSVLFDLFVRIVGLWKMVSVGRWSVIAGATVPAVTSISVSVVSVLSMSVAVSGCVASYLVGVVMVVCRSFSIRKL